MVINKSAFIVLIFSLLLSFGLLCCADNAGDKKPPYEREPREQYEQCQRRCEWEATGQREQQQCEQSCERQFKEAQRQQEERGRRRHDMNGDTDPQRRLHECQERCERQEKGQREKQECQRQCWEQYEKQERDAPENSDHHHRESWSEEEEEGQQTDNPYYFPKRRSFQTRFRDEQGNARILQRFAEKSHLHENINNFRFGVIEINPNSIMLPHHCDAEKILFVTNGRGTFTIVTHESKESFNIQRGTVLRFSAGSTVYLVNQDNREKLTIAVLAQPINQPDKYEDFFPVGNNSPKSYLQTFSNEVLETVLNSSREELQRMFQPKSGQQRQQGIFRKARPEQIRAMTQEATSSPKRREERLVFNLLNQSPVYANQNGRFFEASPNEFSQLRDINVAVSSLRLNQGSIYVPHYNSKATYVLFVTEGNAEVEMACPHLSGQSQESPRGKHGRREEQEEESEERRTGEHKSIRFRLSTGDVAVFPAGHPLTIYARDQNLETVGFAFNALTSEKIFLAGKKNMFRQMDSEVKEISFGVPARVVDNIFNKPQESYFMSFSQQRQRGDERSEGPLNSILDFARLF